MVPTISRRVSARVLAAALLVAVVSLAGAVASTLAPTPAGAAYGTSAATFTGLNCDGWTAASTPAGALRFDFSIGGGGGRGGGQAPDDDDKGNPGGNGGRVHGRYTLPAGQTVYAWRGCGANGTGGAPGYSDGGGGSGGGGGSSALCVGTSSATCTVIAIAGGGGGGGRASDNGAGLCASGNGGGGGGSANGGNVLSGQNGGTGIGGGRGSSGGGGEPGRGGGGGGGTGVAGENGTTNGSAAGANTGGLGGRVTSNNNGSVGGNGGSSSTPAASGGTGHGGYRSEANGIDGGGGGGGYTGGGGGAGGVRRGSSWGCYSTFSGAGGGGGGSSWAHNNVTNRTFDASGGAGGGEGNGNGGAGSISVTFTVNPAPTGANVPAVTVTKGQAASIALPGTDGETGVRCEITAQGTKGTASIPANSCTASYTANANTDGTDSFQYKVIDLDGRESATTYSVAIAIDNRPPVGAAQNLSATKGVSLPISLAASDPDADTVSCSVTALPGQGTVTGSGCSITYLAGPDDGGLDELTYQVGDGFTSSSYTISIDILNRAPVATAMSVSVAAGTATTIELGGSDPDGDSTTCEATEPSGGSVEASGCTVTYTAPSEAGEYTFDYARTDSIGEPSEWATVTVTVTPAAVHGVVTSDETGAPLEDITVRLYADGVGFTEHVATTDVDGAYDLGSDLPVGEYRVFFKDPAQDYVDEWHEDSVLRSTSTAITVDGTVDLELDAGLATGAEIDVNITNPGAYTVALYRTSPTTSSASRSVPSVMGSTSFRGLPAGTYYLSVSDPSGNLVTMWSGNQTARASAGGVPVTAGDVVAKAFTLPSRNTISGTIADDAGPVAGVTVQAYGATSGAFVKSTKTNPSGEYVLRDLSPGAYKLVFRDTSGGHPVTWYGGGEVIGSAATVTMTNGGVLTVDEQLPVSPVLGGTVTGGADGATPLAGAKVTLYRNGAAAKLVVTDANGSFLATGLAPGDYTVLFWAAGHRTEYNLDRYRKAEADAIPLTWGSAETVDATLAPA